MIGKNDKIVASNSLILAQHSVNNDLEYVLGQSGGIREKESQSVLKIGRAMFANTLNIMTPESVQCGMPQIDKSRYADVIHDATALKSFNSTGIVERVIFLPINLILSVIISTIFFILSALNVIPKLYEHLSTKLKTMNSENSIKEITEEKSEIILRICKKIVDANKSGNTKEVEALLQKKNELSSYINNIIKNRYNYKILEKETKSCFVEKEFKSLSNTSARIGMSAIGGIGGSEDLIRLVFINIILFPLAIIISALSIIPVSIAISVITPIIITKQLYKYLKPKLQKNTIERQVNKCAQLIKKHGDKCKETQELLTKNYKSSFDRSSRMFSLLVRYLSCNDSEKEFANIAKELATIVSEEKYFKNEKMSDELSAFIKNLKNTEISNEDAKKDPIAFLKDQAIKIESTIVNDTQDIFRILYIVASIFCNKIQSEVLETCIKDENARLSYSPEGMDQLQISCIKDGSKLFTRMIASTNKAIKNAIPGASDEYINACVMYTLGLSFSMDEKNGGMLYFSTEENKHAALKVLRQALSSSNNVDSSETITTTYEKSAEIVDKAKGNPDCDFYYSPTIIGSLSIDIPPTKTLRSANVNNGVTKQTDEVDPTKQDKQQGI